MDNVEEIDERYAKLWGEGKRSLQAYATFAKNDPRKTYAESIEKFLSQPKSGQKDLTDPDSKEPDETCMEYIIKVISSKEKAEQMKERRERSNSNMIVHTNPMMN